MTQGNRMSKLTGWDSFIDEMSGMGPEEQREVHARRERERLEKERKKASRQSIGQNMVQATMQADLIGGSVGHRMEDVVEKIDHSYTEGIEDEGPDPGTEPEEVVEAEIEPETLQALELEEPIVEGEVVEDRIALESESSVRTRPSAQIEAHQPTV